jgi:mono/diheme cytochrome c family protein
MPTYALSNWELKALTVYVKSLSDIDLPAAYKPRNALLKPELSGSEVFVRYCSACHGKRGEGGIRIGRMGTALNNEDFLALASKQFIEGVVELGRNSHNKVMPAWGGGAGKLDKNELDRVVEWVLSWNAPPHSTADLKAAGGLSDVGRGLYQRACSDCHGARSEGKIGPSLLSKELFQIASTRFLYDTVDRGRPGTAMPAWRGLSPAQISSLVLFLLTHDEPYTSENAISRNGNRTLGKQIYMSRCATCHDRKGTGGIGPSLNSPELATLANHAYFARTIAAGRPDSGMPSWSQLPADQLAGLVAHVRSLGQPAKLGNIPVAHGTTNSGKVLFEGVCAQCHGPFGEGGTGPAIGASAFTDIADDRFLAGMTKYGRTGTEMRPHGRVVSSLANFTDEEIMSIIAHLRHPDSKDVIRQTIRGSVDAGREWYNRLCVNCHGARARGGIGPALSNPTFLEVASDGFLQAQMALGRSDTEMRPMTPYAGGIVEIERARLNDIISFIRHESLSYGKGGDGTQTAFGSVAHGEQWFVDICAKCHGTNGSGTVAAPGLNDANFLSVASDGFLLGTIIRGRMHTGMRSFGQHGDGIASLTARDVTDIATYIRFWVNPLIGPAPPPRSDTDAEWTTTVLAQDIEE